MNVPIVGKILQKNDAAAAENRELFELAGITCINILGGAGSGKTSLLEDLLPKLILDFNVSVLEGDIATTRDAKRIAALGVPVVQLLTEGGCHLTASHVQKGLEKLDLSSVDLLFIENVGNPICPANFDLGEKARIAVLSMTEGDDKPSKYPLLFRTAHLVAITKSDLATALAFNLQQVREDIARLNANAVVAVTSAITGRGIARVRHWIEDICDGGTVDQYAVTVQEGALK